MHMFSPAADTAAAAAATALAAAAAADIQAGKTVFYRVGDRRYGWSDIRNFTALPNSFPVSATVIADSGESVSEPTGLCRLFKYPSVGQLFALSQLLLEDWLPPSALACTCTITNAWQSSLGGAEQPMHRSIKTHFLRGRHQLALNTRGLVQCNTDDHDYTLPTNRSDPQHQCHPAARPDAQGQSGDEHWRPHIRRLVRVRGDLTCTGPAPRVECWVAGVREDLPCTVLG